MTRTEKVRQLLSVIAEVSSDSIARGHAREALSLLDGCVIVPREATEGMVKAGMEIVRSADGHPYCTFQDTTEGTWSAMIAASEEG